MNSNRVCFIICTNNEIFLNECRIYLEQLFIPKGMEYELLCVTEARSMLSGYREAIEQTDALYKVFMHQDVFILNRYFLHDIISIFNDDDNIKIIGMMGARQMPPDFVMWEGDRTGNILIHGEVFNPSYRYDMQKDGYEDVSVADGFLLATKGDVILKDSLFDGWDFYDVSICAEQKRLGKRIVIPNQLSPWCLHDDGHILSLFNYNKYRLIAMKEYSDIF